MPCILSGCCWSPVLSTLLVNYADQGFYRAQQYNAHTALARGSVDRAFCFRREDLDPHFLASHRTLLSVPRGAGLWLWKPYVILAATQLAKPGDVVVYSDSGAEFHAPITPLIDDFRNIDASVLAHDLGTLLERQWTKRDALVLMGCDSTGYRDSSQMSASFMLFKKDANADRFLRDWLRFATDGRLLSDAPSTCGLPEYEAFREHRHDQSIFSLLYKRWGFRSYQNWTGKGIDDLYVQTRQDPRPVADQAPHLSTRWHRRASRPPPARGESPNQTLFDDTVMPESEHPYLYWLCAMASVREDRVSTAITVLSEMLQRFELDSSSVAWAPIFREWAHASLAACHFKRRDYRHAGQHFEVAETCRPERHEYKVKKDLCRHLASSAE
jgi:hypothetical protein